MDDQLSLRSDCVYLLGPNIVSELRKAKPLGVVVKWVRAADDAIYIYPRLRWERSRRASN